MFGDVWKRVSIKTNGYEDIKGRTRVDTRKEEDGGNILIHKNRFDGPKLNT